MCGSVKNSAHDEMNNLLTSLFDIRGVFLIRIYFLENKRRDEFGA